MLTSDLVQTRLYKGELRPRYLKVEDGERLTLAGRLIGLFEEHVGRPRFELDAALKEVLGSGTAFQLHRALAKLLRDRCSFETESPVEPIELRRRVFEAAAARYQRPLLMPEGTAEGEPPSFRLDRAGLIGGLAADFSVGPAQIEAGLYADLKSEQTLVHFDGCEPAWLLRRYNAALAQGVLLRAVSMRLEIRGQNGRQYRELFRKIKFFQLLTQVSGSLAEGYEIKLDGPLSLFQASQKYGLQMASFLPTLLHFQGWRLEATVRWGPKRVERSFALKARALEPYGRQLVGQWQPEEVAAFPDRFAKLDCDWSVSTAAELIDLGGKGVLVPDLVFEHEPSGRKAYMEVLGFWRKGAVASRLKLLREYGPPNFVLALSKSLAAGQDELESLPSEVYLFRSVPIPKKVLAVLDGLLSA